jgi:GNAT superfamily N-acetyltransferase
MIEVKKNVLIASEFSLLYRSVGWEPPCEGQIKIALNNSICVFSLYENSLLVGMARIIGDKAISYYVKDFAILPERQGKGFGKTLMNSIIDLIKSELPEGYKVSLELISSKGKEGFYEKFGFERRPFSWDGAGMFTMLEC